MTQQSEREMVRQLSTEEQLRREVGIVRDIVLEVTEDAIVKSPALEDPERVNDDIDVFLGERSDVENCEFVEAEIINRVLGNPNAKVRLRRTGSEDGEYSQLTFEVV